MAAEYRVSIGRCLAARGLYPEADAEYRQAVELSLHKDNRTLQPESGWARPLIEVAWFRAHSQEKKYQDLAQALRLAKEATKLVSSSPAVWLPLVIIQYRTGDYPAANATLNEVAKQLAQRTTPPCETPSQNAAFYCRYRFTRALVKWRTGDENGARNEYRVGVTLLKKCLPADAELLSLRDEAAVLLGIQEGTGKQAQPSR